MSRTGVAGAGGPEHRLQVAVLGAGITGLAAAHRLAQSAPEFELTVLEGGPRPGGNITTERCDGYLLDGGPDSFVRTKPEAQRLIAELGMSADLISPRGRRVFVVWRGGLTPLPAGMSLAVPTRIGPMLATPLLSWEGKLRALGDLVLPSGYGRPSGEEESIGSFISRRFGPEAATAVAAPLLGGIYAGDIDELSIEATFPQLASLEARHGSLIRGLLAAQRSAVVRSAGPSPGGAMGAPLAPSGARLAEVLRWLRRAEDHAPSPFLTLRSGLGSLVVALAARLPDGALRTSAPATAIEPRDRGFLIRRRGGEPIPADAVIVTTPAHVAARLVPDSRLAQELVGIPYVSTATVFFALDARSLRQPLDGVGFIVPRGEARIMAGTWVSSKWEGRAPPGGVLVRAFVGGARDGTILAEHDDDELTALAFSELERLMGPLGHPRFHRVYRYAESNPQPVVGHLGRRSRIAVLLRDLPGLFVTGGAHDGVGIPDCIRQGEAAAQAVLAHLRGGESARTR
ncbi:MAG: protoporphyrinogen oxidase [Polyangiaceae bacterium]|nr:protoporphyrinogen oxidase [Polyangiaceae bacterium]